MKPNHVTRLSLLLILSFILVTSCNQQTGGGGIPVNEDSVRAHILPIKEAVEYTARFRSTRDTFYRQVPSMEKALNLGRAEAFNRDAVAILLNQKDSSGKEAAGVRIYYGLDQGGQVRMVLVPYDAQGNDIINQLITNKAVKIPGIPSASAFSSDGQTIENGQRCPTMCSSGTSGL
ncbi:MAG TPA: hypothetical protein VFV08_10190 [Puia sp.]|nr:hypothetical protein [Puia sp.]